MTATFFKRPLFHTTLAIALLSASLPAFANNAFTTLEASAGGRLGVAAVDTANNTHIEYRGNERFAFDSTFKFILVAAILKESMSNSHLLQQTIAYTQADLAKNPWNPDTAKHLASGMTINDLCAAAILHSDDTAANLLIKQLGGLQAVTAFARSIGDNSFRLDRDEPELNTAIPGDPRDTTTPNAMTRDLNKILLGDVLGNAQRQQLIIWLKATTTGNARIHAALPKTWRMGDKTGTGDYGTTNDIGIIWPPHCAPILITVYYAQDQKDAAAKDTVVASAARIALQELAQTDSCINKSLNK